MTKLLMKYVTYIHNRPHYRRRWPKAVTTSTDGHVGGFFLKRLQCNPGDDEELHEEMLRLTKQFKQMCDVYTGKADPNATPHILLAMKGLHAGQGGLDSENLERLFPNYDRAWKEAAVAGLDEVKLNSLAHQEKDALDLLMDKSAKPITFLQDVLESYSKHFNGSERELKKQKELWAKFIQYGEGDDLFNQSNVDSYLKAFVKTRAREVKASTVERQTTYIIKILTLFIELVDSDITINRPKTPSYANKDVESKNPLVHNEQIKLIKSLPEQAEWIQLYILLSLHCGLHPKEASSLEVSSFDFSKKPYVVFVNKTGGKTESRRRAIPLIYRDEYIRVLVNAGALDHISGKNPDNLGISIKKVLLKINPNSSAYTLRHTFAHNADAVYMNETAKAHLGGWSSGKDKISPHMFKYGRGGKDTDERIAALAEQAEALFRHFESI